MAHVYLAPGRKNVLSILVVMASAVLSLRHMVIQKRRTFLRSRIRKRVLSGLVFVASVVLSLTHTRMPLGITKPRETNNLRK